MTHAYDTDNSSINRHSFDLENFCEFAVSFHSAFSLQQTAQTSATLINQRQISYNKIHFYSKN